MGLFWFPAAAVNVGEPERPFPGFTFILDPDLRRKFDYPFFYASEQPPQQRPASVAVDRTAYLVGESPLYTVSGTPHSPIYWSSTLNGASTGEVDAFYGQYTDGNGNWSGYGGPWAAGRAGTWRKSVKVGTQSAQVTFTVNPRVPIG